MHRFTHVDYVDRVALVATMRDEIVGIGRYDRIDARSAEVAFNISDHFQGKGIGSVLLEHLAAIAQEFGIARFTAEVLPQNRKMLSVFSDAGYDVKRHIEDGVVEVGFDIEPTDSSQGRGDVARAPRRGAQRALDPAPAHHRGHRGEPAPQLDRQPAARPAGRGRASPAPSTRSTPTCAPCAGARPTRRWAAVPGQVDLAVIAVPAHAVLEVVDECAEAGVKSLLVVSSGLRRGGP